MNTLPSFIKNSLDGDFHHNFETLANLLTYNEQFRKIHTQIACMSGFVKANTDVTNNRLLLHPNELALNTCETIGAELVQGDFSQLLDKELILWLSKKPQKIV